MDIDEKDMMGECKTKLVGAFEIAREVWSEI
jgi:hypothetical protein